MSRTVCHSDSTLPKGRVETVRRLKGVAGLLRGRIGREGLSKVPARARGPTVQADVPGCLDRAKAPNQVGEAIRCHDALWRQMLGAYFGLIRTRISELIGH